MKRVFIPVLFLVIVPFAIVGVVGIQHVPDGHRGLHVTRKGDVSELAPGFHFVVPGGQVVIYRTGTRTVRVPAHGIMALRLESGRVTRAWMSMDVRVPGAAVRSIYERFSSDFDGAFERLVTDAAELETAATPDDGSRDQLARRIYKRVSDALMATGVTVTPGPFAFDVGDAGTGAAPVAVHAARDVVRRVVVLGIDGGDWLNIRPLIKAGKLPNFRRLIEEGATGPLRSQKPMLSPLLWTTMATGKEPEQHGILNFTVVNPRTGMKMPITRRYRKVDAFWNFLSDYGRTVCIAGWLATDPAEKVNGVLVTDKVGYLAFAPDDTSTAIARTSVYPPSRFHEIAQKVVHAHDVTYDEISRFVTVSHKDFLKRRDTPFDPRDPVNNLILLYASTRTYENIAESLLASDHPDVLAVYFEFIDAVSHLFMLYAPPKTSEVSAADYARFHGAVAAAYEMQDEILGRLMHRIGDDTVLMVISDHGFKSGAARLHNRPEIWAGNAAKWHRLYGIVAFWGNGVRRGVKIENASILDVTPTLLALSGLPRAADMPGHVLAGAFEPSVTEKFDPETVATLQRARAHDTHAPDGGPGAASKETMKKLEALGYVTPDNADAHNNLGQRYQERGEYEKAVEEYRKAVAMRPDFYSAYNNMAVCFGKLRRFDDAEQALAKAIDLHPRDFYAMNNLAVLFIQTGRLNDARRWAKRAVATEPGYVNGHITLGSVLAMQGAFDDAEREFREALHLDPGNKSATDNIEKVEQQRKRQPR